MKSQSTKQPEHFKVNDLGKTKELILCENITQTTNEDGDKLYEYDMYLLQTNSQTRNNLISDTIHLKYTKDDELALINKGIEDKTNTEYVAYREYVEWCKLQF